MLRIAEIGSNYRNFADILLYIDQLAADVIKLQHYDSTDLYGVPDRCKSVMLSDGDLEEAKYRCDSNEKQLMISFFNHEKVKTYNHFVDYHKVASSEITYLQLLEEMANTGKDVFVSTGGATYQQVCKAVEIIGRERIILMECNVEYPTNSACPYNAKNMGFYHNCRYGFSDHSKEIYSTYELSRQYGCYAWEKHVKFHGLTGTPDAEFAITVDEFNNSPHVPKRLPNPHQRILKDGKWVRP